MSTGPQHEVQPFQPREHSRFVQILLALWKILRHNIGFKIMALILAVILWAGLISLEPNLTRSKEMTASISVLGRDSLQRRGYVITDEPEVMTLTVRANVPQRQYKAAIGDLYRPSIDLSKVAPDKDAVFPMTVEVPVSVVSNSTYGEVQEWEPKTVTLTVDGYETNWSVPVSTDLEDIRLESALPEGLTLTSCRTDKAELYVAGPASVVRSIRYAVPRIDLSSIRHRAGAQKVSVPFLLIDSQGREVATDKLSVTWNASTVSNLNVTLTVTEAQPEEETETP